MSHPIERYIAHALSLEPDEILRTTGIPNSRKETPKPNVMASKMARNKKNGSCPAVGAGPPSAGGQIIGPVRKAGIANTKVTNRTLTQVFTNLSYSFRLRLLLVPM
jgi:hypothetical protein